MRHFTKVALGVALLFSCASSFAATLPNGILGLKFGMSVEETNSTIRDIFGENGTSLDDYTFCEQFSVSEPDALSCVVKGPEFRYAGVPGEGLGYIFIKGKLQNVYLVLKEPASDAENSEQFARVANELAKDLPMQTDLKTGRLQWQMSDNTALLVHNHRQMTLLYTSPEFAEMADRRERRANREEADAAKTTDEE